MQQAITYASVDPDLYQHMASLGLNELTLIHPDNVQTIYIFLVTCYTWFNPCILRIFSMYISQIAKSMGPSWGPPGSCRPQMVPMMAPWSLLSGYIYHHHATVHGVLVFSLAGGQSWESFPAPCQAKDIIDLYGGRPRISINCTNKIDTGQNGSSSNKRTTSVHSCISCTLWPRYNT